MQINVSFISYFICFNFWINLIQYFYRIYPISVTVPYRTILYVTVFKKNTIVTLFVTFTVTFYPVTKTVTSIVTLNCNGKYDRYTYCYRYYRYRMLKNKALQGP